MSQREYWIDVLFPITSSGETDVSLPGTTAVTVPIGDTSERPASPVNGMLRYNTDTGEFEVFNGSWANVGTSAPLTLSIIEDADFDTQIFVENFSGVDDDIIAFTLGDNSGNYMVPASILNWSVGGFVITTPTGVSSNTGVDFVVTAGNGNATATGGVIGLFSGSGGADGDGGSFTINAGDSGATSGDGGQVDIIAGATSVGTGGDVFVNAGSGGAAATGGSANISGGGAGLGGAANVSGGNGGAGIGGAVVISAGASTSAPGAEVTVTAGAGDGGSNLGGDVVITAGAAGDTADGGTVNLVGGAGGTISGAGGNIIITAGGPTTSGAGGNVSIGAGDALDIAVGGTVSINAGDGGTISGIGGGVLISAGAGGTGDNGGTIALTAGNGDGSSNGGSLNLLSGSGGGGGSDDGGDLNLSSGTGTNKAGDIDITGGNSAGAGGRIFIRAGAGGTNGDIIFFTAGTPWVSIEEDGTVLLASGYTAKVTAFGSADILADKGYVDQEVAAVVHPTPINGVMTAPEPSSWVLHYPVTTSMTIEGSGHFAFCNPSTAASGSGATFDIYHVSPGGSVLGASIGTITFAVGAGTGVVTLPLTALAAGDALVVVYTTQDSGATLANVGFTFVATTP